MVTAVVGENGAGKSTLMKIISGVHQEYEGEVWLHGERVAFRHPREAAGAGVVIIHQELNLIPHLSISENIFLGQERTRGLGWLDNRGMHKKAADLLASLNMGVDPRTPVHRLRVGQQQLVEIARALLFDSKVMIMDEPTSALSGQEAELLFQIINDLKKKGVAVMYISHKLDELDAIADRYEVLRDGMNAGSGRMGDVTREQLIRMMVGRELQAGIRDQGKVRGEEILRVDHLTFRNPMNRNDYLVRDVSFSLHRGEVLGISGLMGAGRTELLEALFGLHPDHVAGDIRVEGKPVKMNRVTDAIAAGIGLVPEDRKLQGLILNLDVVKNLSLASLDRLFPHPFLSRKKEEELAAHFIDKLKTRVADPRMEVQKLSGGNQQKVVIAKWLATRPRILLLDEPTRGIDVGAKSEIYRLIGELAEQGIGLVVVSSELPEILAISDRILVMSESRLTATLERMEATEEVIMNAALAEKE